MHLLKPARAPVFLWPSHKTFRRKKTGPKAGFFNAVRITSKRQPKRRSKQQQLRQQRPKQLAKRQQQRQQQLEQQQRQQELGLQLERLLEQLLELEQQELLLFSSKRSEQQQPTGKRSAGIFSFVFLS
jgi:Skp family chaperone for outer membrane proteins